jgi:3-ketosteroid 9alpha-monooxygenase subunit B
MNPHPDHAYHALAVVDVIDETPDSRSFVLEIPAELAATFAYTAGQFCTFRATIGGEPVVRCYSMSSAPETGDPFTTTVKRVPGGPMSNWMNDHLGRGDTIEVMRPVGLFVLRANDTPIVAFAGGSGITPVISIIKSALATTARSITLVYANRSADSVIFARELERLRGASGGRLTVHHHLDSERGFLDPAACAALSRDQAHGDFYICGPAPYMETVEGGLSQIGVAEKQRFIERFVVPTTAALPAGRHHPRYRAAGRPAPALLVRGGQLCHVHGSPRRGIGPDARQQRAVGRRGRRRLDPDLPGGAHQSGGGGQLRGVTRAAAHPPSTSCVCSCRRGGSRYSARASSNRIGLPITRSGPA